MEKQLIFEKMVAIMKAVKPIGKDSTNTQQGFKFRGIDAVMNELHEAFADNQVFITTEVLSREETERISKNNNALFYIKCTCKFTLHTIDGSNISMITIGEGMDSGDKGTNKAMSIALKYALLQAFLIPTDEPKDPDFETHEVKPKFKKSEIKPPETLADDTRNAKHKLSPIGFQKLLDRIRQEDYTALTRIQETNELTEEQIKIAKKTIEDTMAKNQGNEIKFTDEQKQQLESENLEKEIKSQDDDLPF